MDDILLLLLKYNANLHPVSMSQTEISSMLGITQQAVSYRLKKLVDLDYIRRKENGFVLTSKSLRELNSIYKVLKANLNKKGLELRGKVISGFGEGKKYIQIYNRRLSLILGYNLFLGTLNIQLRNPKIRKRLVSEATPISISDFHKDGLNYGGLFLFRCKVYNKDKYTDGLIVIPLKTKHEYDVIEIVSRFNLKQKLNLKNGDMVEVVLDNSH